MSFTDCRGLAVSAASQDAVDKFDATMRAYLGIRKDTGDRLAATLDADPDMALAHCAKGYFLLLFAKPALAERAKQCLASAETLAASHGASERETTHIAALRAWCTGDMTTPLALWERILLDHPLDVLALRLSLHTYFYLGDSKNLRDGALRVGHAWDDSVPEAGFVHGMRAFGLEECGDYSGADAAGRHAVDINPKDIWATHAVAHVLEMQGRQRDGIKWLEGLADQWSEINTFIYHVWWHLALFWLEIGETDRVLELYDTRIRPEQTDDHLDITNAIAMLWRLEEQGVDVADRWAELGDVSQAKASEHMLAFADAHFLMALAADGRTESAEAMLASMRRAAERPGVTEAPLLARFSAPVGEAALAYRAGEFGVAADLVLPLRHDLFRIGGSHAQRDVFERMLIEALLRAERFVEARALLSERTALKPNSPTAWESFARAQAGVGDTASATSARARAEALRAP